MFRYLLLLTLSLSVLSAACTTKAQPNLIPWPKDIKVTSGSMALTANSRIVATDDALMPLANVLSDEINTLTGKRLAAVKGQGAPGDIVLQLDKTLTGEAHKVTVTDQALVQGGNYVGVCMGTATILQSLTGGPGAKPGAEDMPVTLPHMAVQDKPFPQYTGMMLDIARQFNSIDVLKQCVEMARLYKMKYFHLHMTDDQLFTFPSTKYPKLKGVYTLEELKDLVKFADERGVTIIPEFEIPGHSSALAAPYQEVFGDTQGCVINFINPKALPILSDIVEEMCQVFKSSPYFHMGSDESNFALFEKWPDVIADRQKNKRGTQEQHAWLINEINKVVKKNGKQLIVWEGFESTNVDKDVIVMEWDGRFFSPIPITKAGYKVINVPWVPSVGWPAVDNYDNWNMWQLGSQDREPDQFTPATDPAQDPVIGGQMVLWENPGEKALPYLRGTGVARHERIHSPFAGKTFADFDRRHAYTDQVLDLLVHKFSVKADGLITHADHVFDKSATLTMTVSPSIQNGQIHYTLDGKAPTAQSPVYSAPITLTKSTEVNATLFDADGKAIGFPRNLKYSFKPLTGKADGLLKVTLRAKRFSDPVTVTIKSAAPGEIRYNLDGQKPTAKSTLYTGPFKVAGATTHVKAGLFSPDGKELGEPWEDSYTFVNYEKNITTGKPTTSSLKGAQGSAALAVDGYVEPDLHWGGAANNWLQVDLEKTAKLNEIDLYTWYGDGRTYTYIIETSIDGKDWKKVVDGSKNTVVTSEKGYRHKIDPTDARYIRVTMLHNSANPAIHICELRAYEAK